LKAQEEILIRKIKSPTYQNGMVEGWFPPYQKGMPYNLNELLLL
jgi:hypothetical protein